MATRSAQVPTGYEAFSTLAPVMMWWGSPVEEGDLRRSEAPTRKREYGPGERLLALFLAILQSTM
jgi:hypothetical protein